MLSKKRMNEKKVMFRDFSEGFGRPALANLRPPEEHRISPYQIDE